MFPLYNDLKMTGIEVKHIHYADSGENKAFYDACRSNDYLIMFEFSGPSTKDERKVQTPYGRIREILSDAELENNIRSGVWSESSTINILSSNICRLQTCRIFRFPYVST
jgi:hypothetical protein